MNTLIVSPLLIPLATLVATLLARHSLPAVRAISLAGALALTAAGLALVALAAQDQILATQAGGWAAPYGITLVIDRLSAAMVAITGIIGTATIVFAMARDEDPARSRDLHPLVHGLLVGVCGAFITGDVFNLYVWFEVLLVGSFALLVLGGGKRRLSGTVVYVVLNLVATMMFLLAAGMLYGASGSLNMALLAQAFAAGEVPATAHAAVVLMLTAFSIKAALFPVFGWLP
ncbi:MAG TPA: Na+/H+ antiporter subunit D, partial [Thauera sp.]|nr:Na+/H+ antiporter subunit D [Thauera sp.]